MKTLLSQRPLRTISVLLAACIYAFTADGKAGISAVDAEGADTVTTDSINRMASDPDFIHVSLLTVTPGKEVYSAYGHVALRMECPTKQLDYCFTFEMGISPDQQLRYMIGKAKAGFAAAHTNAFLEQYKTAGRGVTAYRLNLMPHEEQTLWRLLDEEMGRGLRWDFDVTENNCTSMTTWIVTQALDDGARIAYHNLPKALAEGSYVDIIDLCSTNAPWTGLFWKARIGTKGWEHGDVEKMMMPMLMGAAWQHATIESTTGLNRQLVTGEPTTLLPATATTSAPLITPTIAAMLLMTILTLITIALHFKHKRTE